MASSTQANLIGVTRIFHGKLSALRDSIDEYLANTNLGELEDAFNEEPSVDTFKIVKDLVNGSAFTEMIGNMKDTRDSGVYLYRMFQHHYAQKNSHNIRLAIREVELQEDEVNALNVRLMNIVQPSPLEEEVISPANMERNWLFQFGRDACSYAASSTAKLRFHETPLLNDVFAFEFPNFCNVLQLYVRGRCQVPNYNLSLYKMFNYLRLSVPRNHAIWRIITVESRNDQCERFSVRWEWMLHAKEVLDIYLASIPGRQRPFEIGENQHGRPASLDALFNFKELTLYNPSMASNMPQDGNFADMEKACAIYQEDGTGYENFSVLPCGHKFHCHCLVQWLLGAHTCPYCRFEIPTDSAIFNDHVSLRNYRIQAVAVQENQRANSETPNDSGIQTLSHGGRLHESQVNTEANPTPEVDVERQSQVVNGSVQTTAESTDADSTSEWEIETSTDDANEDVAIAAVSTDANTTSDVQVEAEASSEEFEENVETAVDGEAGVELEEDNVSNFGERAAGHDAETLPEYSSTEDDSNFNESVQEEIVVRSYEGEIEDDTQSESEVESEDDEQSESVPSMSPLQRLAMVAFKPLLHLVDSKDLPEPTDVFEMNFFDLLQMYRFYLNRRALVTQLPAPDIGKLLDRLLPQDEMMTKYVALDNSGGGRLSFELLRQIRFTWKDLLAGKRVMDLYIASIRGRILVYVPGDCQIDRPASLSALFCT
ncbi:hypothetical protein HDU76_012684 [Blyttiomyces sp. JEL0837]|nr:hypothetical protein HDU76_012684 [Blyttiomyces sp. JEL0837]